MLDQNNLKKHKYLKAVIWELNPKYNFDSAESIYDLCLRMDDEDWEKLKTAIKYPNGCLREVPNE